MNRRNFLVAAASLPIAAKAAQTQPKFDEVEVLRMYPGEKIRYVCPHKYKQAIQTLDDMAMTVKSFEDWQREYHEARAKELGMTFEDYSVKY